MKIYNLKSKTWDLNPNAKPSFIKWTCCPLCSWNESFASEISSCWSRYLTTKWGIPSWEISHPWWEEGKWAWVSVALIKNNLREIYLHFLKESRDFFLALIHILVLVLDFFFKRREFGVVHMHRISNAVCKSSTFPLGELLPKWFSWLNNDRSMIQVIAITWNMISGGGMNLYWTEPVYVGNCQHTRSVHCTLAHLLARVSMFI